MRIKVSRKTLSQIFPIIIRKQNIRTGIAGGGIHHAAGNGILETIVVERMRVQRGELINPDTVGPEDITNLRHQRTPATMANQMNGKFHQRMTVQVRNRVRLRQHIAGDPGDVGGADVVRCGTSGHLTPIEFDHYLAGVSGQRRAVGVAFPLIIIIAAVRGEGDRVNGYIGAQPRITRMEVARYLVRHGGYPTGDVAIVPMRNNRHIGRFRGAGNKGARQKKKRAEPAGFPGETDGRLPHKII